MQRTQKSPEERSGNLLFGSHLSQGASLLYIFGGSGEEPRVHRGFFVKQQETRNEWGSIFFRKLVIANLAHFSKLLCSLCPLCLCGKQI